MKSQISAVKMSQRQNRDSHSAGNQFSGLAKSLSVIVVFALIGLAGCSKEGSEKPNFLIIFTDDQTYRAIGYSNALVKTPHLDKLAHQGIIFNMAFTSTPVCTASRASILTGLYPQTNGTVALNTKSFIRNITEGKKYKTLAHFFSNAGYTTFFSGKSHLGDPKYYGFKGGEESLDYDDKKAFRDVSDFLDGLTAAQKPFLIWLAPRQPHVPLKPEQKWLDIYLGVDIPLEENFLEKPPLESFYNQGLPGDNFYRDSDYTNNYKGLPAGPPRSSDVIKEFTRAYYATVSHLDFQVGNLIEQLKANGQMENTVIIFLSDNGYFLGNHGLGNKLTMHEESVHVPMFIYWDKLEKKGRHSDALVSSVDILPTMLDLAGLNIPGYLHGSSLKPVLSNTSSQIHDYVVSESVGVGGELGTGHRMVRTKKWKYILSDVNDEALINLENDPYELNNLIGDIEHQEKLLPLKSYFKNWKNLVGDRKPIPDDLNQHQD
jgi:arylsulfatase A-like enzyme